MKPLKIKNDDGDTIEIKYDADGGIKIRHSDIDPKLWGELHEYAKRVRQPGLQSFLEEKGIDLDNPEAKEVAEKLGKLGGYTVLRGKTYSINSQEVAMIHEAIKQAGGIVPNWSSRP